MTARTSTRQLDQRRAHHAFQRWENVREKLGDAKKRVLYRSYVDRLGPMIIVNGLGQALAMEYAQHQDGARELHLFLVEGVASWLRDSNDGVFKQHGSADGSVLKDLIEASQSDYMRAQQEAIAWLSWHKRFVRAAVPDRAENADNGA